MADSKYEELSQRYEKAGQGHVFNFYSELNSEEKEKLLKQLEEVNVEQLNKLYIKAITESKLDMESRDSMKIEPLTEDEFDSNVDPSHAPITEKYIGKGLELISKNLVGVILLAGGQGSRLGSSDPKGCYSIGLKSNKSLFQIQAERIISLQTSVKNTFKVENVSIPFYIMTSEPTYENTKNFFIKHNYFGLNPKDVYFFNQGTLPCLSNEGKILLENKFTLCKAPDGNGGIYEALFKNGIMDDMRKRGTKYIHLYCVDNCLVRVACPEFFGYCFEKKADCGSKVVPKQDPNESVGVVCLKNGKHEVVEYSELPESKCNERDSNNQLKYRAGNICNHFYTFEFLERMENAQDMLEIHIANKKIKHIDLKTGNLIVPDKPNGIKLEAFVFDVFPFSKEFVVYEVNRKMEFSPLKNGPGSKSDSPETSKRDLNNLNIMFVEKNGGKVKDGPNKLDFEISPLVSLFGENLEFVKDKVIEPKYYATVDELKSACH